ncbi:glutaminase family protein [Oleiagrimonas sp. C23AA]|uniref:glutaminase family protein n=1 Tax=Oleiagrimonas sp. C23AA TaxID=2719047 RepID=UPI00141EE434|nr:glutaminase family protein [Oleiagrimonas sp. C23AA]NII09882.1 DUF4965 domain-containing protein [Oleiagrimonas sp. C23AA]
MTNKRTPSSSEPTLDNPSRRGVLKLSGSAGLALAGAALLPAEAKTTGGLTGAKANRAAGGSGAITPLLATVKPIRPPAVPLAVRQPYLSTWLPATILPGTSPQFWHGSPTGMAGMVRVDGETYLFMGDGKITRNVPDGNHGKAHSIEDFPRALEQTVLEVTATRSRFTLQGGGIELVVEFLSPVEPGDTRRQSMPLSYVHVSVRSLDGKAHHVQLYMDMAGNWASAEHDQAVKASASQAKGMQAWSLTLANPKPLSEQKEFAAWGHTVWATAAGAHVSHQAGKDVDVRGHFAAHGTLDGSDTAPSQIKDGPVYGLAVELGQVTGSEQRTDFIIGQVRETCINYLGTPLRALWTRHFPHWQDMLAFFHGDAGAARKRADLLDARVRRDAHTAGGHSYEGLCALALRQAYGGTELVIGPDGEPWAFLKEISSDGNMSTVDVVYPAAPVWMYLDPDYLRLLLVPLLHYAEKGGWPKPFAEHDLGSSYPQASGHNDGKEEDMPVEETGNMLIMVAAYLKRAARADARTFARRHYRILKQWAGYLERELPDPGFQNQTDDFAGSIAHSVNLALKGIIALAAMGQIASAAGHDDEATHYQARARKDMAFWAEHAKDPNAAHLDLTYHGKGGGDGTWGTLYNGFADVLLGTGLIPESIRRMQAKWYAQQSNAFGLPLQVPHSYAKSDWELFTAAWLADQPVAQQLIDRVYAYADTTPDRVPFSDLYNTVTARRTAFSARPVQGGIFAPLALRAMHIKAGADR